MGIPHHREVTARWVNASVVHLHRLSLTSPERADRGWYLGKGLTHRALSFASSEDPSALRVSLASISVLCPGNVNNLPPSLFFISSLPFFTPSMFDDLTALVLLLMLAGINVNEVWVWLCSPQHLCGKVRFKAEAEEAVWCWTP